MKIKILSILIVLVISLSGCAKENGKVPIKTADSESFEEMSAASEEYADTPVRIMEVEDIALPEEESGVEQEETSYKREAKRDLLALMMSYPNEIEGIEISDGLIYIIMKSGRKILYDDKKVKSFDEKLANADIQDTMELIYPLEEKELLQENDFDPGRFRNYGFLNEVYGDSQETIEANLDSIELGTKTLLFNTKNDAIKALADVFVRIDEIVEKDTSASEFVYPITGTYYYRLIEGTERLSLHSFGIAIDIKNVSTDYWREASREQGQARLDVFPKEVVKAFEENGFIWGGKWAHFDLLHFEFRPELIMKSKYSVEWMEGTAWHEGYPQTEDTRKRIEKIDQAFDIE